MWQDGKYGQDAKYFDRLLLEQFLIGGVDVYIHKYLGSANSNIATDTTQPQYTNLSETNIQDLLFLENRDRKYSQDIVKMRAQFQASDLDLDLSQFGLSLGTSGMLNVTVHLKNCVDTLGRKLMSGDVLEMPCMKDFYALDEDIPVALKKYYVVQTAARPSAGYSASWWNHLWRCKCTPMVSSQEYNDILSKPVTNAWDDIVNDSNGNAITYSQIFTSDKYYVEENEAVIKEAEHNTPLSGYETENIWEPQYVIGKGKKFPLPVGTSPALKFSGYMVGNGKAENGYPVTAATEFTSNPTIGDYILRTDYFPARLYRWSGSAWQYSNSNVRTPLTNGEGHTQRDQFINNANTFVNTSNVATPILQNISTIFRPDMTANIYANSASLVSNTGNDLIIFP
jgi:hypothetical protein